MDIIEKFNSYKSAADESFDKDFFAKDKLLKYAKDGALTDSDAQLVADFLDFADEEVLRFCWQFYYLQFYTDEDFSRDIWQLEKIEKPKECEEKFPGGINSVIYLAAIDNLNAWLADKELDRDAVIENYYARYRYLSELNVISYARSGICRLAPFLYAYAKPLILRVGRLNFQFTEFKNYSELYEDESGKRIFAALPNYTYNNEGLQDTNGFTPVYEKTDGILKAHVFGERGRLSTEPFPLSLDSLKLLIKPGDRVVTIHIPEGGRLLVEDVKKSIADAGKIFAKYFEPIKAFVCQTWFIDPALRGDVIMDGSNMAAFADLFDVISGPDNENHSIFEHIFKVKKQPLENLVPKNDFQKRALDRALRGDKIHWGFGVLKKELRQELFGNE